MADALENIVNIPQFETLPKYLKYNSEKFGNDTAMREKNMGIWKRYTWRDCYEKTKYFSLGLVSLGLRPRDKVSLIGESKPQLFWAALAVQAARGIELGIFSDCSPSEVKYYVEHSDSKFVIAHDQEQVDKLLQIKGELPQLNNVVYWDPKGLWFYDDPILVSFDRVLELGRKYEKGHVGLFEQMINAGTKDDIAAIVYTSGTTGLPKGAMFSQQAMQKLGMACALIGGLRRGEDWFAFMPLVWYGGQALDFATPLMSALVVNFPEKPETLQQDIREVGTRGLIFGARQWESINRTIQYKMGETHAFQRFIYHLSLGLGHKMADARLEVNGHKPNLFLKALYQLSYLLLFRPLLDKIGLLKLKLGYTTGTAVSPDIIRFFCAVGIEIRQVYGSAEMGLLTAQWRDVTGSETCGDPLNEAEIRISTEGEIQARSPWMLHNYYNDHQALDQKLKDGWYCTGDFGYVDDNGKIVILGRMEDVKLLKDGRQYSPQFAETRLRVSPYIKDAIVVGKEDNEFVGALICIDLDSVGHWAEKRNLLYTTFADLAQNVEIISLIKNEIQKLNPVIPEYARIKKFANLPKELDPDEGEMTRNRKLRRDVVEKSYATLIAALYEGPDEVIIATSVTYQDGRERVTENAVKITSVDIALKERIP